MFYGHILSGGGVFRDRETGEMINVEYLRECFFECADLFQFIQNVESGMITISITEYTMLPPVLLVAWRIYKDELSKKRKQDEEKLKAAYGTR